MIGMKVKVRNRNEDGIQENIFECISEPYIAISKHNSPQTFVMLLDLHSNQIIETRISQVAEKVSETEFKKWNQS